MLIRFALRVCVALWCTTAAAWAAGPAPVFKDCPFSGTMPNYVAVGAPRWWNWNSVVMRSDQSGKTKEISPTGAVCLQTYDELPGKTEGSTLENMMNFKESWEQMGAQIVRNVTGEVTAQLMKDGHEYWLEASASRDDGFHIKVVEVQPFKRTLLPPSGLDFHLLGHMPNFVPSIENKKSYAERSFPVGNKAVTVRGALTVERNTAPEKQAREITPMEIVQNYRAALADLHAEILRDTPEDISARIDDQGKIVWIYVDQYRVVTLEERPFKMTLQPPTAYVMKDALDKDGHIALYVNFDFAKASLKADAQPVVAQVVDLLKRNPDLKLTIDGHTDIVGAHDYNVKLSQDRAAAVVAAIVAGGIDRSRLASAGYGPDKPIASNETDDGRAKNRRVELVKTS